eukprot:scaffold3759_cov119-Isochrysis_galbana.AAC.6
MLQRAAAAWRQPRTPRAPHSRRLCGAGRCGRPPIPSALVAHPLQRARRPQMGTACVRLGPVARYRSDAGGG